MEKIIIINKLWEIASRYDDSRTPTIPLIFKMFLNDVYSFNSGLYICVFIIDYALNDRDIV